MKFKLSALALVALTAGSLPAFAEADTGMLSQNRDDMRGIQIQQQNQRRAMEDRALAARQAAEREANRRRDLRRRNADRRRNWDD